MHTAVPPRTQARHPQPHGRPGPQAALRRLLLLIGTPTDDGDDAAQARQQAGEWLAAHFGEHGDAPPAA